VCHRLFGVRFVAISGFARIFVLGGVTKVIRCKEILRKMSALSRGEELAKQERGRLIDWVRTGLGTQHWWGSNAATAEGKRGLEQSSVLTNLTARSASPAEMIAPAREAALRG
jgi:hypothetical protein